MSWFDRVKAVTVGQKNLCVEVDKQKLIRGLLGHALSGRSASDSRVAATIELAADLNTVRRGAELQIHAPDHPLTTRTPDPALVKTVARARKWYEQFVSGEIASIEELARRTGLKSRYVRQVLRCATLSPEIMDAILAGRQARQITGRNLIRNTPLDWRQQRQLFL